MRRILLGLLAALSIACLGHTAEAQYSPASQPLGSVADQVILNQGTGCANNIAPCQTVWSPSLRFGNPIITNCTVNLLSPWQYQECIDSSDSPAIEKIYIGSTWWPLYTLNPSSPGPVISIPANSLTSPFELGSTSVTTSGAQLNYLNAATGTTGSGNVVFSASPALTGVPTAPTAAAGTDTTQLATTAFVTNATSIPITTLSNNYVVQATDNRTIFALGGNSIFTVTLPALPAGGFSNGYSVTFINTDSYSGPGTGRAKIIAGAGGGNQFLWPALPPYTGQTVTASISNGEWVLDPPTQRWQMGTTTVDLYVNSGGSDSNNDCLNSSAPCQTMVNALETEAFNDFLYNEMATTQVHIFLTGFSENSDEVHLAGRFVGSEGNAKVIVDGNTAITGATGMIATLGTITPGTGYTNGQYNDVAVTGGSGTGATVAVTVSGGVVTAVGLSDAGNATYKVGDVLSVNASSIGGTGSGFSIPVSGVAAIWATSAGLPPLSIQDGANLQIQYLTFEEAGNPGINCVEVNRKSHLIVAGMFGFLGCDASEIYIGIQGFLENNGAQRTIAGNAAYADQVLVGGVENLTNMITSFPTNVTFSGGYLFDQGGTANYSQSAFNLEGNTVTGQRFDLVGNAVVYTGNGAGSLTYFPGSTAGSIGAGALYDTITGPVTLDTLSFGSHLISGGTSYNGSAPVTIATDATNANTATAIVARDGFGNFSAGTITAAMAGGLTFGTHLTSGGSSYNGSANTTITSDATNANTASTIVARDASGNFSAGTITASLTGGASLDLPLTGGTLSGALVANAGTTISAASSTFIVNNPPSATANDYLCWSSSTGVVSIGGTCGTSDARLKDDWRYDVPGLDAIMALKPGTFDWLDRSDTRDRQVGLTAQSVEKFLPEAVSTGSDRTITLADGAKKTIKGVKSLDYAKLTLPLIVAVQQQQREIAGLKAEIGRMQKSRHHR